MYDPTWPIWTYQEQVPPAKFIFDDDDRRGMALDSTVSGGCIISGSVVRKSLLLEKFQPDTIINTGSAGGYNSELNVGDIVISTEVRFHDVDVTAFGYEIGQMAQLPAAFPAQEKLINIAEEAAQSLKPLKIIKGLICTGDTFMADPEKAEIARNNFPTMEACEMEAAAIAQVCYQFKVPFVIIRSLSDIAGKKSELSFEQYLPVAAKNASILVANILNKLD